MFFLFDCDSLDLDDGFARFEAMLRAQKIAARRQREDLPPRLQGKREKMERHRSVTYRMIWMRHWQGMLRIDS